MITLPLRSGPDIDWRSKCHTGDSQGETDACTVFAIANWAECMLGKPISDQYAIGVWRNERRFRYRDEAGGLQATEAFAAAMIRTNWLPHGTTIRRVANLDTLPLAPLVVCLSGLDWTIPPGTDLLAKMRPGTNHAVLAVADLDGHVWIENSHGPHWGGNGFARMTHATFARHCVQLWQIIPPGAPMTIEDADDLETAGLVAVIGDQVRSIAINLQVLGYRLPCDSRIVMADLVHRSMQGQLTDEQQIAKGDLADVYILLMASGVTDKQVADVWAVIKKPEGS